MLSRESSPALGLVTENKETYVNVRDRVCCIYTNVISPGDRMYCIYINVRNRVNCVYTNVRDRVYCICTNVRNRVNCIYTNVRDRVYCIYTNVLCRVSSPALGLVAECTAGCASCIVKSCRSRRSFISSPVWIP